MPDPRATVRWADVTRPWLTASRVATVHVAAVFLLALCAIFVPVPTVGALVLAVLFALLWRRPESAAFLLIAFMGNTKINYYAGFFTFFPEYTVIVVALAVWALKWMEQPRRIAERNLLLLFAIFFVAGCLSFVDAINVPRVFAKAVVIALAGAVTFLVIQGLTTRRLVGRALLWLEVAAGVVAGYGILQFVGGLAGWPVELSLLSRYGNPEFNYSIGAPVVHHLAFFYRANSFFNDSNILAGFLSATIPAVLALFLHHTTAGRRRRARTEAVLLALLVLCSMLTLSRSGFLAVSGGGIVVLLLMPRTLGRPRFWLAAGAAVVVLGVVASRLGVNPILLVARVAGTFANEDISTRTHATVAQYALTLLAHHPLTGVGLRNFGYHYAGEVSYLHPGMMAHNAFLSYFAEAGLLGGFAFLALIVAIARRPIRALRARELGRTDPELYAWIAGLLGALVALAIGNIFYDFSLRTFVWVYAGLAVAAARLWERRTSKTA